MAAGRRLWRAVTSGPRAVRAIVHLDTRLVRLQEAVDRMSAAIRGEAREDRQTLRQYHLQLGRLSRAIERLGAGIVDDPPLSRPVPLDAPDGVPLPWEGVDQRHPDPDGRQWRVLESCPACGTRGRTIVNPWNKLLLLEKAPDDTSARYDYAICHGCGILFASRRPCGARYRFLLEHFGEVTAKRGEGRDITNPVLNPYPLDESGRAALTRRASRGVWVSDHEADKGEYLPGLARDRFEASGHVDIIGQLLRPRGARVLEVRAKTGALMDGLRRYWDADVCSMPMWESQQVLVREVYGIPVSDLIDFEHFRIPFDGPFDLIVSQHMLTHVLQPLAFLAELRRKLKPGGHVYFYNEPDDLEYLALGQSMFATLNPLHMQAFDQASLGRALAACGFEMTYVKRHGMDNVCLARESEAVQMTPIGERALRRRIDRYRAAYDRSVLRMDARMRSRVADQWEEVVARAVRTGLAEFDERGRLRLVGV